MNVEPSRASIDELVRQLPEIYQPIYGHPELSASPSRLCEDRMVLIASVHGALARLLGRPVKVLDLGCSQGYFSIGLAQLGAEVSGVDFLSSNINVCNALAAEQPALLVEFSQRRIEDVLPELKAGDFDLVLGLSVFHHLIHQYGAAVVNQWLDRLGQVVDAAVFELALSTEPLYWAAAQPDDTRTLLSGYAFVYELGRVSTHLSDQQRPLYVASNRSAILGDTAYPFLTWKDQPHALAQNVYQGSRRYFFGPNSVIKVFRLEGPLAEVNRRELGTEISVLTEHGNSVDFLPELFGHEVGEKQGWLARGQIPGKVLLDLMSGGIPFDDRHVVGDVLQQLAQLERQGLYHNDVRPWNIVVSEAGGASLIDFGSITTLSQDCVWPQDIFIAFFIFLREVSQRKVERVMPQRQPFISPYNLPQPYRALSLVLWSLPRKDWSFQRMQDAWQTLRASSEPDDEEPNALNLWIGAAERHIDQIGAVQDHARRDISELHATVELSLARQDDEARTRAGEMEQRATEAERQMQEAFAQARQMDLALQRVELAKDETLQLVRTLAANDAAHAAQTASTQEESLRLRQSLLERERLIGEVRLQLVAAAAETAKLSAELAQQREDALARAANQEAAFAVALAAAQTQHREARDGLMVQAERVAELLAAGVQVDLQTQSLRQELFAAQQALQLADAENKELEKSLLGQIERERLVARNWEVRAAALSFDLRKIQAGVLGRLAARISGLSQSADNRYDDQSGDADSRGLGKVDPTTLPVVQYPSLVTEERVSSTVSPDVSQSGIAAERFLIPAPTSMSNAILRPSVPVHPISAAKSLVELLQHDGSRFVQCAYLTILKRPADPAGLAFHSRSLGRGVSKHELLRQFHESPEGRSRGTHLAGMPGVLRRAKLARLLRRVRNLRESLLGSRPHGGTNALDLLLSLNNGEFIRGAYTAILHRSPDTEGYNFYLNRLQRGAPKWLLLAELAGSQEARGKEPLQGLASLVRMQRRARLPVIGALLRGRAAVEGTSAAETRLRAIEQRLLGDSHFALQEAAESTNSADSVAAVMSALAQDVGVENVTDQRRRLTLGSDYGIDEAAWLVFLEQIISTRLFEPLRGAGTPPPAAALWLCVDMSASDADDAWRLTSKSLAHLQHASEYPVRIACLGTSRVAPSLDGADVLFVRSLAELAASVDDADHVIFLKPGDEVRPELHMALKYFGCFGKDVTVVDMYFRDNERIYPILLHAFDVTHGQAVDYFHSRFGIRGGLMREMLAGGEAQTLRELMLVYLRQSDAPESRSVHIAIPLLSVALTRNDIEQCKAELVQELMSSAGLARPAALVASGAKQAPKVSVIICTKDGSHLLQQLVWRLLREPAVVEIVLVSNNSSNAFSIGLLTALAESDRVVTLRYDKPFNFSAQCNLGAKYAKGEHLLFLNDDICPVTDGWLETMQVALEPAPGQDAIVGPMLIYPDQSVQHAGMFLGFNNVAGHTLRHARLPDCGTSLMLVAPRKVSCLTGAALLMKRRVFDCLNGFDPLLATYLQDVDLSLRAVNSGFPLVFEPRAILFHMESVSVKPELVGNYMSRVRQYEYTYFAKRWGDVIASGDEWVNPSFDASDESMRTLRT